MKTVERSFRIVGSGSYLPKEKVTSQALAERINFPAIETCATATDVPVRHFASGNETQSFMGAKAISEALEEAGLKATDLDLIISASAGPHQLIPCTAAAIQRELGLGNSGIPCFDVNSTCLSFVNGLDIASRYLQCGAFKRIAVVSAEVTSTFLNWNDSHTAFLFGDGAAAFILEADKNSSGGIAAFNMKTFSSDYEACQIRGGGTNLNFRKKPYAPEWDMFEMNGKAAFRGAAQHIGQFLEELFSRANVTLDEIDAIVPHQASPLALSYMENRLGFGSKMVNYLRLHGNQVAVSIPFAWHKARREGIVRSGSKVLLIGTSAGISIGGAVVVMS